MCKLTGFHSYLSIFKLGELLRPLNPPFFSLIFIYKSLSILCYVVRNGAHTSYLQMWWTNQISPPTYISKYYWRFHTVSFNNLQKVFLLKGTSPRWKHLGGKIEMSHKMLKKNPNVGFSKFAFLPINMGRISRRLFSPRQFCLNTLPPLPPAL